MASGSDRQAASTSQKADAGASPQLAEQLETSLALADAVGEPTTSSSKGQDEVGNTNIGPGGSQGNKEKKSKQKAQAKQASGPPETRKLPCSLHGFTR